MLTADALGQDKIHLERSQTPKDSIYVVTRKRFVSHVVKGPEHDLGKRLEAAQESPDLGDLAGQLREVLDQLRPIQPTA